MRTEENEPRRRTSRSDEVTVGCPGASRDGCAGDERSRASPTSVSACTAVAVARNSSARGHVLEAEGVAD